MDEVKTICWKHDVPQAPTETIPIPEKLDLNDRLFFWKLKMLIGKEWSWPHKGEYHVTWAENMPWAEELRNMVTGLIPPDEYPKGLSVGCAGSEAVMLATKGYQMIGVDCNPADAEHTRKQGVLAFQADMHDLRFPNESFDFVATHHCAEHCQVPWLVILEFWAVTKPNGLLLFVVPPFNGEVSVLDGEFGMHESHSMILHEEQWKAIFLRLGYELVSNHILGDPKVSGHLAMLLRRLPYEETVENCRYYLQTRLKMGEYYPWPDETTLSLMSP